MAQEVAGAGWLHSESSMCIFCAMGGAESESVSFLGLNFIVIGVLLLAIFTFFVLLTRKRWKAGFLHNVEPKKEEKRK